jgi:hypothetical protein
MYVIQKLIHLPPLRFTVSVDNVIELRTLRFWL